MGISKESSLDKQREILPQDKHWNLQEYFVYFKGFNVQYWGERSVGYQRIF